MSPTRRDRREAGPPPPFAWAPSYPRATLVAVGVACLAAVAGIVEPTTGVLRLRVDPSTGALVSFDDPDLVYYERVRAAFGSEEMLIVGLEARDLFTPARLQRLADLGERLAALDFVSGVLGLANATEVDDVAGQLALVPLVPLPVAHERLAGLRQRVLGHPLYGPTLLAPHGRATSLLVRLENVSDDDFLTRGVDARIGALVSLHWSQEGERWWLAGTPVLRAETSRVMTADLARFAVLGLCVGAGVFFLAFRTREMLWLPTLTMAVGLLWLLGAMGWLGHAMNLNTTSVPILVIVLGYAYLFHVLADHREERQRAGADAPSALVVRRSLARVWLPVSMTGLTTAIGFASLCISPLSAIREFGGFAALGALCACAASLTLAPAVLALRSPAPLPALSADDRLARWADRFGRRLLPHRAAVFTLAAVVTAFATAGTAQIRVAMEFIGNFPRESPVRENFERVNAWFGGASPFYVVLEARHAGAVLELENLRAVYALGGWLEAQPEVGAVTSLAKLLAVSSPALRSVQAPEPTALDPQAIAARLAPHVGRDWIAPYVDADFRRTTLLVHSRVGDSAAMESLVERVEQRLGHLPPALEARVTGGTVLIGRALDAVSRSQSWSLGLALGVIYATLCLYLRSPRDAALALLPNLLPVVFCFGLLGWSGVTLNSSTALLGCVVLGIAVDDTIHFVAAFRRRLASGRTAEDAAIETLRSLSRPITYTTAILCAGFAILVTSDLRMLAEFGAIGAASLLYAWAVDLALTPLLCVVMARPRRGAP